MSKRTQTLDMSAERDRALAITPCSAACSAKLDRYIALVLQWSARINLVAPSTLPQLWTRHVADSLQLVGLAPGAKVWVDLGSGGGFPGIPIACALAERRGAEVHLVESNQKKAAFLREAVRITGAPATVHAERIENFGDSFPGHADVVTARALAPLNSLLDQALPLFGPGTVGLFPKGQDVEAELTEAAKYWSIQADRAPSRTSPEATILIIRGLARRSRPA